jgi:uncharacterized protein (TIGR02246 family)
MGRYLTFIVVLVAGSYAAAAAEVSPDEAAIRKAIASYVEAFNKADAKAVAAHWTPGGEFITPGGQTLKGRDVIEKEFAAYFGETKDAKVEVASPAIRFISPGVAVEEGMARLIRPEQEPVETEYVAVHVKTADGWKMDSVREQEQMQPQSHYEQLKPLEWLIGEWVDADENASVETRCQWTKNQNFITRSFKVRVEDRIEMEGTQIIGWDPAAQTIRSWIFDSEGGFGVGAWTPDGDRWTVRMLQVLANGEKASSVNILTKVDDNTFTFRSTGREVDGELLPNIDEVTVVRR